jgi:uncharacterized protein YjbJ (UPF0337 family)
MDWDEIERSWNELKGEVKRQWSKLTDEDVELVEGKYAELLGLLQERYGHAKEQAEREPAPPSFSRKSTKAGRCCRRSMMTAGFPAAAAQSTRLFECQGDAWQCRRDVGTLDEERLRIDSADRQARNLPRDYHQLVAILAGQMHRARQSGVNTVDVTFGSGGGAQRARRLRSLCAGCRICDSFCRIWDSQSSATSAELEGLRGDVSQPAPIRGRAGGGSSISTRGRRAGSSRVVYSAAASFHFRSLHTPRRGHRMTLHHPTPPLGGGVVYFGRL